MQIYKSKYSCLPGSSYDEVLKKAKDEHKKVEKMTKRQPYVRSTYFNKDKIFISNFWPHLMQKNPKARTRRLKLYKAAVDLMRNTRYVPETIFNGNDLSVLLHRFYGVTKDGVEFCVQIKQDKRSARKDFLSVFERKAP